MTTVEKPEPEKKPVSHLTDLERENLKKTMDRHRSALEQLSRL